jgi:hypothetical protein
MHCLRSQSIVNLKLMYYARILLMNINDTKRGGRGERGGSYHVIYLDFSFPTEDKVCYLHRKV